jgi:hypothetical protein
VASQRLGSEEESVSTRILMKFLALRHRDR